MIEEIRTLARVDRAKANHIRNLQARNLIKKIVNEQGYMCYDTDELRARKETVRVGRPPKLD